MRQVRGEAGVDDYLLYLLARDEEGYLSREAMRRDYDGATYLRVRGQTARALRQCQDVQRTPGGRNGSACVERVATNGAPCMPTSVRSLDIVPVKL
jgi:hypothetical protein